MNETLRSVVAITMFIEDRARAKEFFERVFGAEVVNEDDVSIAFRFDHLIVNLLEEPAAPALIAPARVGDRDAAARFQLTIQVANTDAVCARLAELGVALLNGPLDREWGVRTAAFTDPDGHIWEVAAPIAS